MNSYMSGSLEKQTGHFNAFDFLKSFLHSRAYSGFPIAIYLLCCFYATSCTGQGHTAASGSTVAALAEPVKWSQALRQKQDWYASSEAARIADNLLLYQRDNGGWNKNTDMAKVLTEEEKAVLQSEAEKGDASTIDNKAIFTQMEYLARVYAAMGQEKYKESFLRGMDYLLEAQYGNGGWPQYYPIREGYYEHITFNDRAMIGVMRLLREVAHSKEPYAFVDTARRNQAVEAIEKGLDIILQTQIRVDGRLTAWCAQYDRDNLTPQKARSYELPSISGGESVGILSYLIEIEKPGLDVVRAVEGAVSWMERVKITGIRVDRVEDVSGQKEHDVVVVIDPTSPPLLARFYEIGTNQPMFVGRDGIVREKLSEIERERRSGYSWYVKFPQELLEKDYLRWRQKWVSTK